ncbi:hypothetical protein [Pedobacter jejuensis]|uniref:Uncharacterized protein n=1 Tax=Pedobacter jejuensis TaxID=1268550 RepID=A0A3N0BY80_9SPHI|nr:hypothetical protein [Pedobacter jejuensis]RNL54222.1 hypothetical protein D7004_09020 [Pedobacter jejuensis]
MDNKKIEDVFNKTFSGLTLFYRDTELSENLISKYQVGQIIMERGFTDMTFMGGGLQSNFRYLIASAFGKDLSAFNPEASKVGHIVLTSNSYFKVLDIYHVDKKTQVFLLNIPEHAIDLFHSATTNIETDIIQKARESFESKKDLEPIKELHNYDWQERTKFPIGMNDNGVLFFDNSQIKQMNIDQITTKKEIEENIQEKKPWWKF